MKVNLTQGVDIIKPNLVEMLRLDIQKKMGKGVAEIFMEDPIIDSIKDGTYDTQRFIVNRYFWNKLTLFKSKYPDTLIMPITLALPNDGDMDTYFNLLIEVVLPFFKKHNILQVLANRPDLFNF